MNIRGIGLDVLADWRRGKARAHDLLDRSCHERSLSPADAALLHNIVLAVIRNLSLLDRWTASLSSGRHLDHRARDLLRTGLAQLLLIDIAPHAAVNETVAVAGKAKGLVNAVLRRASREKASLLAAAEAMPLPIRCSHPDWLVKRWITAFGAEAAGKMCAWNQQPAETFVRPNRLHPDSAAIAPAPGQPHRGDGFIRCPLPPRDWLASGAAYAQDPSTAIAPRLLAPQPGERILDACAAPGGKTALIAELMDNRGIIIAADASPSRLKRLRENLGRLRADIAAVHQHDLLSEKPPPWGSEPFDRILLDVPCSNTGVMRRRVDVRWRLQKEDFIKLAGNQLKLLHKAAALLKPGGSLVYSTCSIDAEENRGVVDAFLQTSPAFTLAAEQFSFPPDTRMDGAYAALLARSTATQP